MEMTIAVAGSVLVLWSVNGTHRLSPEYTYLGVRSGPEVKR